MSVDIETIRADLAANTQAAKDLNALSTIDDIANHLKNTVWPFQECLVDQLEDLDGCIEELMNHEADILQPETGAQFLAVFTSGLLLVGELKKRLGPGDDKLRQAIGEFENNTAEATAILTDITIPEIDDEEDEDADEEDDDEDEGDAE